MKQFPIIIKTEQGNYPSTITCHNFPEVNSVDPKWIERDLNQMEYILKYYKIKNVNLLYTQDQVIWIILLELKECYRWRVITNEMAHYFNKEINNLQGHDNISELQRVEPGFTLRNNLTIVACYAN